MRADSPKNFDKRPVMTRQKPTMRDPQLSCLCALCSCFLEIRFRQLAFRSKKVLVLSLTALLVWQLMLGSTCNWNFRA